MVLAAIRPDRLPFEHEGSAGGYVPGGSVGLLHARFARPACPAASRPSWGRDSVVVSCRASQCIPARLVDGPQGGGKTAIRNRGRGRVAMIYGTRLLDIEVQDRWSWADKADH